MMIYHINLLISLDHSITFLSQNQSKPQHKHVWPRPKAT
jgi:hypothetical protein